MVKAQVFLKVPHSAAVCLAWYAMFLLQHCLAATGNYVYETDNLKESRVVIQPVLIARNVRETSPRETMYNETILDNHSYYTSRCFRDEPGQHAFWVNLDDPAIADSVKAPASLATGPRKGTNYRLSFVFPYYGHELNSLVITTGGFIYTGSYIHKHLAATQYIAPLMGNFAPSQAATAGVLYYDNGTALTVEWRELNLADNIQAGHFTFQTTLCDDGRIIFAYKNIPIPVSSISDEGHPVKVGLSDAYYIDTMVALYTKKREIFEYHSIAVDVTEIGSGTIILITPLPTCNMLTSCYTCVTTNVDFNCSWCEELSKCSDGLDRNRQSWLQSECKNPANYIDEMTKCPGYTTPPLPPTVALPPKNTQPPPTVPEDAQGKDPPPSIAMPTSKPNTVSTDYCKNIKCQHGGVCEEGFCNCLPQFEGARCQKLQDLTVGSHSSAGQGLTVGAIISITLISLLILGLLLWAIYAYRHPTSPSGLFVLEAKHRLKGHGRGSNGVKYKYHQQMDSNQVDIQL